MSLLKAQLLRWKSLWFLFYKSRWKLTLKLKLWYCNTIEFFLSCKINFKVFAMKANRIRKITKMLFPTWSKNFEELLDRGIPNCFDQTNLPLHFLPISSSTFLSLYLPSPSPSPSSFYMSKIKVLFVLGFTKMSTNKTASQLVGLLNDLFGRFDR